MAKLKFQYLRLLFISCLIFPAPAQSQEKESDYFTSFDDALSIRLSLSRRYTSFAIDAPEGIQSLKYRPNTPLSLGLNATYKSLSISGSAAFGFLNRNSGPKGKTKAFDFQTHIYNRHWVTDIYAQFYKGYFLNLGGPAGTRDRSYYLRPDLKLRLVGASVYRLFNGDRFSYRAGFLQNEWQKKSAGTFLLGAEIYYGSVKGDSALVPSGIASFYPQRGIDRVRLLELGPGAGYAYTAVWQEHFFLTGSCTINADLSLVKEETGDASANRSAISPNANFRAVGGFNSQEWAVAVSFLHTATNAKGKSSNHEYSLKTGEFRFTIVKRFNPGPRLKEKMDGVLERFPFL